MAGRLGFAWLAGWFWVLCLVVLPLHVALLAYPSQWGRRWAHQVNRGWGAILLLVSGVWVRQRGQQRPLPAGPVIFVSNHRSYLDIPILHRVLPGDYQFLGKRELAQLPLFGFMYNRVHLALDRGNPTAAAASLRRAEESLRRGTSLVIFPEGTSRGTRLLSPFKEGAFVLATQSGCPIVPICIQGSRERLPTGRRLFWPGRVCLTRGPVLAPTAATTPTNLRQQAFTWIETELTDGSNRRPD